MTGSLSLFWLSIIGAAAFPSLAFALCLCILMVQVAVLLVRYIAGVSAWQAPHIVQSEMRPVFSVHIATHNEPPALVTETLEALSLQSWSADRFEAIVMDNNTADASLWEPVQDRCQRLGENFRFLHRMGVKNAKAGALNIALAATRADATHIITIDADYCVSRDFLREAAQALTRTGAAYVQFPQAYRGAQSAASGVDMDLQEYFRADARMADGAEAVLLTGTLCVISREALEAVGGWSGRTTTEDAELGVRLCRAGFAGRFIPKIKGAGLLPLTLKDLGRQRYRWSSGNLRTLLTHFRTIVLRGGHLETRQSLAIVSQLTAWLNFSLLPAAVLFSLPLIGRSAHAASRVAAISILLTLADIIFRLGGRAWRDGIPARCAFDAIASRIALAPASARATTDACLSRKLKFLVTRKSMASTAERDFPLDHAVIFLLAAISLPSALTASPLVTFALLALCLPLPAALVTQHALSSYRDAIRTV